MWKLDLTDLYQLKGGGGERFAHFIDRLIAAEAACGGLAQAEIAAQLRVNIKDGGVDTEVKKAIPQDKSGWFDVPTCWQFKSGDAKDNELQQEINKPYARHLVEKGYGYRFCLLSDLTPEKLQEWEALLKTEALAIHPKAADPRVIHGGHLRTWAERFPAISAALHKLPQGIFHWSAWAANRTAVTRNYVPNSEWDGVRRQILEHVQFDRSRSGSDPCLFIGGAAGVGKTRLVFETLAELLQSPALVLVVEDEQEARKIGTWLANADRQFAILVADECSPQARYFLNEVLRGHTTRVRVISIDNTGEPLESAAGRILLSSAEAQKNAEAILEANFPHIPADRRRQYADHSRGFIRLAADLCEHDTEVAAGDLAGLSRSVEPYARHRLGKHLELVSLIALFHKVGFRDDAAGELEALCQLTGYSKQQFLDAVRAVRESPGFVVQAGRYWYVTPEIVAQVLFNVGWQHRVAPDLKGFLEKIPDELRQQLVDRVATHARKEVREEVRNFFRRWFSELTALGLTDLHVASLAAAVVETSPEEYLPLLRLVIEAARPGELEQIQGYGTGRAPRRTLVWLLERLVSFPEYFEDCEASLFRLALEESEPQLGNNATAIWSNLFGICLSGTAAPFPERLRVLERRTASPVLAEARLGFTALACALSRPEGHLVGKQVVAGRFRPADWQPATVGEERDCCRAALAICERHLNAALDSEPHRLAFNALASSLHRLLRRGLADELRRILTPSRLAEDESRKFVQTLDEFLEWEIETGRAQANETAAAYVRSVQEWSNLFRPADLAGLLRSVCARALWDQRFARAANKDKDETVELAASIVKQPSLLASHLDWLASPEARSAEGLGFALGQIDEAGDCGRMIFEHAIANGSAPLLRGYLRGMVSAQQQPAPDFLGLMTRLESAQPELAIDVLAHAGDGFDAFNRILRLIDSQRVSPRYLVSLGRGLGQRELTAGEVNRLLPYFTHGAAIGEAETGLAGVRFLETWLLFEPRASGESLLASAATRSLIWEFAESVFPFLTGHSGSDWIKILKHLAVFEPHRAVRLLARVLLAENAAFRAEAEDELIQFANTHPDSVMDGFGAALLDPERGWLLQVGVCRDLVVQLPSDIVVEWVRRHGIEAAKAIARHLPLPHTDEIGNPVVPEVLETILSEYDDDEVFVRFLGGSHSGESWWSNGGDQFRQAAETARKFLTYPNRRIREWAKEEANWRHALAEREDQKQEERFLPLW